MFNLKRSVGGGSGSDGRDGMHMTNYDYLSVPMTEHPGRDVIEFTSEVRGTDWWIFA